MEEEIDGKLKYKHAKLSFISFINEFYNNSLGRKSEIKLSPNKRHKGAQLAIHKVDALGAPGVLGIKLREPKEEAIALLFNLGHSGLVMLNGKL